MTLVCECGVVMARPVVIVVVAFGANHDPTSVLILRGCAAWSTEMALVWSIVGGHATVSYGVKIEPQRGRATLVGASLADVTGLSVGGLSVGVAALLS